MRTRHTGLGHRPLPLHPPDEVLVPVQLPPVLQATRPGKDAGNRVGASGPALETEPNQPTEATEMPLATPRLTGEARPPSLRGQQFLGLWGWVGMWPQSPHSPSDAPDNGE